MTFALPSATRRIPSFVVLVLAFTLMVTALLWWQVLRSHQQMQQQVLLQARQSSLHLADAMAGQVQAQINIAEMVLRELDDHWDNEGRQAFDQRVKEDLLNLPRDLSSHLSIVDASGYLVYNSLALDRSVYVGDRAHFQTLKRGDDPLIISAPVRSRLSDDWVFLIGRPILRKGQFQGAIYLLVQCSQFSQRLASLKLSEDDIVSLVHPDGPYLARSNNNEAYMGQSAPADRPYRLDLTQTEGNFRIEETADHPARTYGWKRLESTGLVISVGIADKTVLTPLVAAHWRTLWATGFWSLLLLVSGGIMIRDQLRAALQQLALAKSEELLKNAQQVAQLGSWEMDHATGKLSWSDESFRMLGLEPGSVEPSMDMFIECVHPDDRDLVNVTFEQSLQQRIEYNLVFRIRLPSGDVKYVRERGRTTYLGDVPVRSVGTMLDVTEVRRAQNALEELNDSLEQRVAVRTEELTNANRELAAFAYSVSHDLRTPLRSIHGFAHVLSEDKDSHLSPAGLQNLKRIQDRSRRMGQLITDLLSLAHQGNAPLKVEPVDMGMLAGRILDDLQAKEPSRTVHWHIDEGLTAYGDREQLQLALQKLLENAWKFSSTTPDARIWVSLGEESNGMRMFCIKDNGVGFDMAYYDHLFQPFKRIHPTDMFEGSGVGLVMASRIIARHGGTIRGEGHVGQGAAFYFTLPSRLWGYTSSVIEQAKGPNSQ